MSLLIVRNNAYELFTTLKFKRLTQLVVALLVCGQRLGISGVVLGFFIINSRVVANGQVLKAKLGKLPRGEGIIF